MSESGALAAALEAAEETVVNASGLEPGSQTNLTQRHGGTEATGQPADRAGDSQNSAEVAESDEAEASGTEVPGPGPGNQLDTYPTKEREEAVARIRNSTLPPALRDRLAAVVEAGQSPRLDVAACLEAIEETLPDFLRGQRGNVLRPEHPLGQGFFHGTEELTDAETLATKQLERSGLLRGQRVRVGD